MLKKLIAIKENHSSTNKVDGDYEINLAITHINNLNNKDYQAGWIVK
jgi:hypothetical protein